TTQPMPLRLSSFILLAAIAGTARSAEREVSFEKDVRPILKAHCTHCHGEEEKPKGGVDLRLRRFMDKELDGGARIVVPGNPDKATLIRRVTLDLTGLPPTPAEADAFVNDTAPAAYEKVVDRLLASPAYGERWARHWLDVAGYADSNGYGEADSPRLHAWRY